MAESVALFCIIKLFIIDFSHDFDNDFLGLVPHTPLLNIVFYRWHKNFPDLLWQVLFGLNQDERVFNLKQLVFHLIKVFIYLVFVIIDVDELVLEALVD